MNKKNKDKGKKKRDLSKKDLERLEILHKAEEIKGEQLSIDLDSNISVENNAVKLLGQTIDDPVEKHKLYYDGLSKLLQDNLPKGKENEKVRRIIFDETNILINRGAQKDEKGIRGSDGRMAYIEDLEIAIQIVADWVSKKGSASDLFMDFWDKNEELKYGHQD